jgi:serine/threonine protein phosphatase PrpC
VIAIDDERGVLAVADGAGGHASGAIAARHALEAIDASIRGRAPEDELRTSILNGFEMANETVRGLGVGAGTTLAVVEVQGAWIRTYHVGDTGIIVTGQRGRIKGRTLDHSPTGYAVESGLMNDREAIHHEERHLISNMIGSESMRIDMGPSIKLASRDTVLIATDGLFDNMHFDDIVERVRKGHVPHALGGMTRLCHRRMENEPETTPSKPDDLTILAFRRNSQ